MSRGVVPSSLVAPVALAVTGLLGAGLLVAGPAQGQVAPVAERVSGFTVGDGDLFISSFDQGSVVQVPGNGAPRATVLEGTDGLVQVALDDDGNLYAANETTDRVVKVPADGTPQSTVYVGTSGSDPEGVAIADDGTVYVSLRSAGLVRIDPDGTQTSLPTGLSDNRQIALDSLGNVYVPSSLDSRIAVVPAAGTPVTYLDGFTDPTAVAIDTAGDLYASQYSTGEVVKVALPEGTHTVIATGLAAPSGLDLDAIDNLYVTEADADQVLRLPSYGGSPQVVATDLAHPLGVAAAPKPFNPPVCRCTPPQLLAKTKGRNNGAKDDRVTIKTAPRGVSAGAVVKLFKVRNNQTGYAKSLVATGRLDKGSKVTFVVKDKNGNRKTRYFARIKPTKTSPAQRSNNRGLR